MAATQTLVSAGTLLDRCRRSVARILDAAAVLGISPELALDQVPYFSEVDAKRIEDNLVGQGVALRMEHVNK